MYQTINGNNLANAHDNALTIERLAVCVAAWRRLCLLLYRLRLLFSLCRPLAKEVCQYRTTHQLSSGHKNWTETVRECKELVAIQGDRNRLVVAKARAREPA